MAIFHDRWDESCFAVSTFSTVAFRLASCFLRSAMWWSNFFMSFLKFSLNISRGFSTSLWSWSTSETDRVIYFRTLQETKAKSKKEPHTSSTSFYCFSVRDAYTCICVSNICSHILQRAEHQHRAHSSRPAVRLDRIRMNPTGFEYLHLSIATAHLGGELEMNFCFICQAFLQLSPSFSKRAERRSQGTMYLIKPNEIYIKCKMLNIGP